MTRTAVARVPLVSLDDVEPDTDGEIPMTDEELIELTACAPDVAAEIRADAEWGGGSLAWVLPIPTAQNLEVTPRHLQNLEKKGLLSRGWRHTRMYAFPLAFYWMASYKRRINVRGAPPVRFLHPVEAWREACRYRALGYAIDYARTGDRPNAYYRSSPTWKLAKKLLPRVRALREAGWPEWRIINHLGSGSP